VVTLKETGLICTILVTTLVLDSFLAVSDVLAQSSGSDYSNLALSSQDFPTEFSADDKELKIPILQSVINHVSEGFE